LHSAASNESWFPHVAGKTEKTTQNIITYNLEMVNKWLMSRRGACPERRSSCPRLSRASTS
jgi:hypothetical protein